MVTELKIAAIGGNQSIADELLTAIHLVLGPTISCQAIVQNQLRNPDIADLFVCLPTRINELATIVPRERIVGLELMPSPSFFVKIAQIPANETVYIFENNRRGAQTLADNCSSQGIAHINFDFIAYEEMAHPEVITRIESAKYIAGSETMFQVHGDLHNKYSRNLNKQTKIVGAHRIPTLHSGTDLMQWITLFHHKKLANEVAELTQSLSCQLQQITATTNSVSASIEANSSTLDKLNATMVQETSRLEQVIDISQKLSQAAQNISSIAETIKHISGQTNLLALNATIEAARVGTQGRGFAVVAKEVGKLAEESRTSIDIIRTAVGDVQTTTQQITPALLALSSEITNNQQQFSKVFIASNEHNTTLSHIFQALQQINTIGDELTKATNKLITG